MSRRPLLTNFPCDLHSHTTRSDGADTPQESIESAAALGMTALGITDHDIDPPRRITLANGESVDPLAYAADLGVTLVLGYEFSTNTWVDDVHICGYRLDWEHPDLQAEVAAAARSKSEAYRLLTMRLTELGMPLDWEADVLHYTTPAGQPAVRQPDEVQRKHVFEAIARRGYAPTWREAKLLVIENPELNIPRRKIGSVEAIDLIHRCGGAAILAHPYLIPDPVVQPNLPQLTRREFIHSLIDAGLDGIEVRYTYTKTTYVGNQTPAEIEAEVRREFVPRLRLVSAGSDYHADHKRGVVNARQLGEAGLTEAEFAALLAGLPAR